jgi:hypothetical protein
MTEVGVLLPLRIETRFSGSTLRLRVVPDALWLTRHDPRPSEAELTALERYAPQAGRPAWGELAAAVGAARAAFLVRTYVQDGAVTPPVELRKDPVFPRIVGFPDELLVWLASGGGPLRHALTLTVDQARLAVDFPDPTDAASARWWEDWDEAVQAGLAGEIPLDGDGSDLDLLVVTGLGAEAGATLFGEHRDQGTLGLLAPGTATNSVDGAPAADLATAPNTWFDLLTAPANDNDRRLSQALTGDPGTLGALPGPAHPHRSEATAMVAALWPALWGFAAADVWAIGRATEAAAWAKRALFPEGPLPALRVGAQPYGLLPATALDRWVADPADVEEALVRRLVRLRGLWQDAAERRGTVAGATTEELLDLLGHVPSAAAYRHRRAAPLELWWLSLLVLGTGVGWDELDDTWEATYRVVADLGLAPARRYGARGRSRPLRLPLVVPPELPAHRTVADVLQQLIFTALHHPALFHDTRNLELEILGIRADSLLLRLIIRALQVAIGDVGREALGEPTPAPEPLSRPQAARGRLEQWILQTSEQLVNGASPAAQAFQDVVQGLDRLLGTPVERLERLLRATVDTALYRLDPWLLGAPTRRLRDLLDRGVTPVLGAYGWIDAPRPGTPGPTPAGLLHAPSPGQALTATVLRDRAINDPEAGRWHMTLSSRTVREAARVGEHVRVGAHLAEALGREVERIATAPDLVQALRDQFPLRSEHDGRRVCDGLAVLAADPAGLGFDADKRARLVELGFAVDAYGDLLVAEAVHHVTQGRAAVAGAVMDAAAGLSRPPELEVVRTPRQGRAVATSVLVLLPEVPAPAEPTDPLDRATLPPVQLADASAARFVADQVGEAADWSWSGASHTVTLADLELEPADALALTRTDLERLAADALGVTPADLTGSDGSMRYEAASRLVALLGRAPAGPDATTVHPDQPSPPGGVDADLRARYTRLLATAQALAARLETSTDPAEVDRLLLAARRWGIAPDPPAAGDTQAAAARARELLVARVQLSPDAAGLDRTGLIDAITKLASPTGQLALLSRLTAAQLPSLTETDLDLAWLTLVAAVRPPLAHLEVHQFTADVPLVSWASKPQDPWQTDTGNGERMVVAYAAEGHAVDTAATVAAAVLDRWTEVIPDTDHSTAAAFGFDAPAARAPQAILLAVPPDPNGRLDPDTVRDAVVDTRKLAHARMARPAELDAGIRGLLPTALLPATGRTEIPLEPKA